MRFSTLALMLSVAAEAVIAEALPLEVLPREFRNFNRRKQISPEALAANGKACAVDSKKGVCDNGRCGTFVAPTGFTMLRGGEAQCGGVPL
ncbi:hypothetical protein CPLU01_14558 [Colletotrichum plurivorum]|uniref:Uncharacterized protein n=1 Tax=Colletotrichum plurivorum TaxID=2175906 RepID=A0A8H6MYK6_9PEZI|nr:hypothetical protein CPLU01_14558 [Colletotrichum plurivorum]